MKRHKMTKSHSKRSFTRGAVNVNRANTFSPMRGGWRL